MVTKTARSSDWLTECYFYMEFWITELMKKFDASMNLIFKTREHLYLINKYILSEQGVLCSLRMIEFVY
jgi:hypothetical protein